MPILGDISVQAVHMAPSLCAALLSGIAAPEEADAPPNYSGNALKEKLTVPVIAISQAEDLQAVAVSS